MIADAEQLLRRVGVEEDPAYYGQFDNQRDRLALVPPQIVRAAWSKHDADLFASTFSKNGSLLMGELQVVGREEVRNVMRREFTGAYRKAGVVGHPIAIRHLNSTVSITVTEGGIVFSGENSPAAERRIRIVWVIEQNQEGILVVSNHSTPLNISHVL